MDQAESPAPTSEARKPCIACREPIPVAATVCSHCRQRQRPEKPGTFKKIAGWAASIGALLGILASVFGGAKWIKEHWVHDQEITDELAVAASQAQHGDYERAVESYASILEKDPRNQQAADGRVSAAMLWATNFRAPTPEGESTRDIAAPKLDRIFPILDAGVARATGKRRADILAHLGWAHWLDQKFCEREFGPAAEQCLREALEIDPSNVYASAMLGNMLLQKSNRDVPEAIRLIDTAVQNGAERPWVRTMQIGGLRSRDEPRTRAALVRAVDEMRRNMETLDDESKHFVVWSVFTNRGPEELAEALRDVPFDDAWATFQWLHAPQLDEPGEREHRQFFQDFIHANLLELSGKKSEALTEFQALHARIEDTSSTLTSSVESAIDRLGAGKRPR
jgi:tetratricopeptide (TPR) repeat protein